jgi:isopentenyldiphosphate isomerase
MSSNSTIAQQNDPHELLEVFDASGRPTGRAKSRASIHLDGDWHQAFHCWILRPAAFGGARQAQDERSGGQIVLQRRSLMKDTFPGCWDAAAAGHWRFGESPEEAAREIGEELGLRVDFSELLYRGRERLARVFPNGLVDREHHHVYVLACNAPLLTYRPDPREVSAVGAFQARELLALLGGRAALIDTVEAVRVAADGAVSAAAFQVARSDVVPYSMARVRRVLRN